MDERDEVLMAQVAAGDADAMEALYDRHAAQLLGVLLHILHDRGSAEEALQETFWRVWNKAEAFDPARGAFRPWLFSIARRLALDDIRRQASRPQAAASANEELQMMNKPDPGQRVDEAAADAIDHGKVMAAMQALSAEQKQVLEMAYFQGLTRQEIAERTGQPLGTVHTRARLGLQKLRTALQGEPNA